MYVSLSVVHTWQNKDVDVLYAKHFNISLLAAK